ncbi:BED finger-nbs-lrr resistance-like protein [Theobroma cacao]|uniref:BED finger-nbs-lrr resistance-like protein n=1 Tax=Theobroma cacao TaxID=3641 RepID=A0A061FGI6_THECC|nr:BED finger-nbs-lrr resistance-like protein [Theobroma cacao]
MVKKLSGFDIAKSGRLEILHDDLPTKDVVLSGCQVGSEDPVALPSDLCCLRIFECHNLRTLSDISLFQQTNELRFCSIHDCRGIESVLDFSSSSLSPCTPFQKLELLWLENLDNLHMLVKVGDVSTSSTALPLLGIFSHLKSIRIERCSNMKQLFPHELGHDLQILEYLVVANCGKMEEIIASEEEENHKGKGTHSPMMFSLPKLRKLKLKKLPKLKSICSSNTAMKCDSLGDIAVRECPNLKRMPLHLPVFQDTDPSSSHSDVTIRLPPVSHPLPIEEFPLSMLTEPLAAESSLSVRLQLSPALRFLHFPVVRCVAFEGSTGEK